MQILLSPAKTMTGTTRLETPTPTEPRFSKEAREIALQMTGIPTEELASLLKLSPKLAAESYLRFQAFHATESRPIPALTAYTGVVFKHIHPQDFSAEDYLFAQAHLRIVSICYGLLRPLDAIKPYRMEYDVRLPELTEGNMYAFWRERQTGTLVSDVKADDGLLINLASLDVQPAFDWKQVEREVRVITPEFKVLKQGKAATVVIYAKMARGEMSRYIIKHRLTDPEALKAFRWEGFHYVESMSQGDHWTFLQDGM